MLWHGGGKELYMHMIKTKINVKWILKKLSLLNS